MKVEKLADGTFATTPVYMGPKVDSVEACPNDDHTWEDDAEKTPFPEESTCFMQIQRCRNCCATRSHLTGDESKIREHLAAI